MRQLESLFQHVLHRFRKVEASVVHPITGWWVHNDTGEKTDRYVLLIAYICMMWWSLGAWTDWGSGSYTLYGLAALGLLVLAVLPRRFWIGILLLLFLVLSYTVLQRNFGMIYPDHRAYINGPLTSISSGGPFYEVHVSENPYMPWSALIYWPLWREGIRDFRPLLAICAAVIGFLVWLARKAKGDGLILVIFLLFSGFMSEQVFYMFIATLPCFAFLFLGLYLLKRKPQSVVGILAIAMAAAIKQPVILFLPFLGTWLIQQKLWRQLWLLLISFSALTLPFIWGHVKDFVYLTVYAQQNLIPAFHYSELGNFWRIANISFVNIPALFPGGPEWVWAHRLLPVGVGLFALVLLVFVVKKRSWQQLIIYSTVATVAFMGTQVAISLPIYFVLQLAGLAFV